MPHECLLVFFFDLCVRSATSNERRADIAACSRDPDWRTVVGYLHYLFALPVFEFSEPLILKVVGAFRAFSSLVESQGIPESGSRAVGISSFTFMRRI